MINKVKKHLKNIIKTHNKTEAKEIIKKLVLHPDLTEIEQKIIYCTYGEGRMVANTCDKLGLGECSYYFRKQIALTKLYYILGL